MSILSVLLFLGLTCRLGHGFGLHGFHFRGLEEPQSYETSIASISEGWIEQLLDHFNPRDNRTWQMRYYKNDGHYKKGGPIFIMIGGESEVSYGFLTTGLMYNLAVTHNAMMYQTEHRYYGKSKPTKDVSSSNLQYLSVDQALADIAYFIEAKKKEKGLENSTVIVFGGSYAGSMAAWARLKYPHLVQGALASSAPTLSKVDFYEYYEVVAESIRKHSEKCVLEVKNAFDALEELLSLKDGPERMKQHFNLCDVPDIKSSNDIAHLMSIFMEIFAAIVQYDGVVNGKTKIAACCETMTASHLGTPLEKLAHLLQKTDECLENNYEKFIEIYKNDTWDAHPDIMRVWWYQTCSQFGNYQTTDSKKSVFGSRVPLSYYISICRAFYGDYYDAKLVNASVKRTNIMYGGRKPDLRNVIFTNGNIDPWHSLSVLQDLNRNSHAIYINGSSHCSDLYNDQPTDVQDLTEARKKVRKIIGSWISS